MTHHFCTYCDQGYAARMLCLFESLKRQGEPFRLFVLCFDTEIEAVVRGREDRSLIAIGLTEFLSAEPDYAAARRGRNRVEGYFTATPVLVRHCLEREPEADRMIYLDADLFFFAPPSKVREEEGEASVGIVPHRYASEQAHLLQYGRYNVGWVSFKNDTNGRACLEWWRERCIEWCFDRVEEGRFADQGYLDEFPRRFGGVREIAHPGVNLAPWNVAGQTITSSGKAPAVNGYPVMFFHYQGVREVAQEVFDPGLRAYGAPLTRTLREIIYRPYLRELVVWQETLFKAHGMKPQMGYQRMPGGEGWRARWQRFKARWLWLPYRRLRRQLVRMEAQGVDR